MNHNNYYIKSFNDTKFRNIESYFNLCQVSVSKVDGIGEFGEPKNVLTEEYNDKREIDIILPPSGEEIFYKPTDVTMNILVEGNTSYKVQDQVSIILQYIQGGIYFKDLARGLGNKLILVGKSVNSGRLKIAASNSEYTLISLKFKKLFDVDLQVIRSVATILEDFDPTFLTFMSSIVPATIPKGVVEYGFYFKQQGGSYVKYVSATEKTFTGLTPNTTYICKAFYTTEIETTFGNEVTATTPAS